MIPSLTATAPGRLRQRPARVQLNFQQRAARSAGKRADFSETAGRTTSEPGSRLQPQDGTQFVAQLAQFSSLEQEVQMRTDLDSIKTHLDRARGLNHHAHNSTRP